MHAYITETLCNIATIRTVIHSAETRLLMLVLLPAIRRIED